MEKRPRPFTAEKRIAEITGTSGGVTNDDLLEAFQDLSAYVQEVAGRLSVSVPESKEETPPPPPLAQPVESSPPAPEPAPSPDPGLENVKREVAVLKSANPEDDKLVSARDELETVTEITDKAANEIMNQSDEIHVVIDKIREEISTGNAANMEGYCATLEGIATNLLMACEFQDLTGQRLTKVANTLHTLEDQIGVLFHTLDITEGTGASGLDAVAADDERPDTDLLHGPQDEGEGISQADIDAMFD